jgi:hypothetical protein
MTTIPMSPDQHEAVSLLAPVVFLSPPPADPVGFARYRSTMSDFLEAQEVSGVLLVTARVVESSESFNPMLHIGVAGRPVDDRSVILAEAVAAKLGDAGLPTDLEQGGSRGWPAAMAIFDANAPPAIHLSLPVNFGPDLMILAGAALAPLRESGVLLAVCGDAFDDRIRLQIARRDLALAKEWARGETPDGFRGIYPMLFMMGAAGDCDRFLDVATLPNGRIVALDSSWAREHDHGNEAAPRAALQGE